MNILWSKIWVDLWLHKGRTWLAIINMVIGIFSVGTLFGMIDLQLSQMDSAHQKSNPSHISLLLRNSANGEVVKTIRALPHVAGVEPLTQLSVRFRLANTSHWQTGTLFIRENYESQLFDVTTLVSGSFPSPHQIALENLSAQEFNPSINPTVEFETPKGIATFNISGIVRHPFVKPPKFGGQMHFFADKTMLETFGLQQNSFRQLLVQTIPPYDLEDVQTVARDIRTVLNQNQILVNATLLQDPQQHWGRTFLAGIHYVLQIMAMTALMLASALTIKTVSAHLIEQTTQIGILKALGAQTSTICNIYLTEIMIMAIIAIVIAMPLGVFMADWSACQLLDLFNIACIHANFSWRAVEWMIIGGIVMPLLVTFFPVLQSARMRIHCALNTYGLMGTFGLNKFEYWLNHLTEQGLPTLYAAAFGNLFRSKLRFLLTQSVLIATCMTFLLLTSLIASLHLTLDNEMARCEFAVRLGFSQDQSRQKIETLINNFDAKAQIETWRRVPLEIFKKGTTLQQKGSLGIQLLALPAHSTMYHPLIEKGRALNAEDAGHDVLIISSDTAERNGIEIGDNVEAQIGNIKQQWQIVGTYRWLLGNNFAVEAVYAPLETLQKLLPRQDLATYALIRTPIDNIYDEVNYLAELQKVFDEQYIPFDVYTTQGTLQQRQFAQNQFNAVIHTLMGLASMMAAIGSIGLSGTIALNVLQRQREIGVLRAIGASSKTILTLFWFEGIAHTILAWLLSIPIAYALAKPCAIELGQIMLGIKLDFKFAWDATFYCIISLLFIVSLAAYLPARKATKLTVSNCLSR